MHSVIRRIDRALKRLYLLEIAYRAEDFLLKKPMVAKVSVGHAGLQGALYVRNDSADLSVGIYLSESVRRRLLAFRPRRRGEWTVEELDAFGVAAEEVSHFHYLLFHASAGRPVSQLELEVQGEVDKFLLLFFAQRGDRSLDAARFDRLFEQLFFRFRLAEGLSEEARERYREANGLARRFVLRLRPALAEATRREAAFERLRRFYRLGPAEKMSLLAR